MKIAFFYPANSMPRPIDPRNLHDSNRGLTGSEGSCIYYAKEMAARGHEVYLLTNITTVMKGDDNVNYLPYSDWTWTDIRNQHWDALCSWMSPEPLMTANPNHFRLFNQQVSDFNACPVGWEEKVDLLTPLSNSHASYLSKQTNFDKSKWRVCYNGVHTSEFLLNTYNQKTKNSLIWASSHDRGLHRLLEIWPEIKKEVPDATLSIFYNFSGLESCSKINFPHPNNQREVYLGELGNRARYILYAIEKFKDSGVSAFKSVSRKQIAAEMSKASILAYPLDPVHYTETFGVTVLEACASGTVPVICAQDCFLELWAPASEWVPAPYSQHKKEYLSKLINLMKNENQLSSMRSKCIEYSSQFDWSNLVPKLERTLISRGQEGLDHVQW